jgi:Ca-activated chloride channel family protein
MGDLLSFQNPGMLLWLLPLGGTIVLLYLLKMRRRDLTVPATFLWPNLTTEVRANSLFQRLRFNWLLVLQILALIFLVVALARPQTQQKGLPGEITVIVLDTSASMNATDLPGSRYQEALRICRNLIDSARPSDRISLIEAGPTPRVVFPLSNDSGRMRTALDSLAPSDAQNDVGEALRLAAALVGQEERGRILLLSDGAFGEVNDFSAGKARLVFRQLGTSSENVAIIALGAAETSEGRQVFCGLRNYGKKSADGMLSLFGDSKLFNSRRVVLNPKSDGGWTDAVPTGTQVIEAKFEGDDLLKSDNYAAALADPNASIRVLLVGGEDPFIERAMTLDPRVTLDRAAKLPDTERENGPSAGKYDVVVFDGVPEEPTKARGVLAFGVAGPASPVSANGSAKNPKFVSSEQHPLMRYVDMRDVYIDSMQKVQAKATGQVLAETKEGPLIVAAEGRKRQIYVAFKPLDSDFPLQVGFPIFIANALEFLAAKQTARIVAIQTGKTYTVAAKDDSPATLAMPNGGKRTIRPTDGSYTLRDVRIAGEYRLTVGKETKRMYASLLSDTESNIAPVSKLKLGSGEAKASGTSLRITDFWRPLLLLALLVLAGEWWLFARRS